MRIIALLCFAILLAFPSYAVATVNPANAQSQPSVSITEQKSFTDWLGRQNIVGTVKNDGNLPIEVKMAAATDDQSSSGVVENLTYGRVVWPFTESPFKITIPAGSQFGSKAFVRNVAALNIPRYDFLVLNYSNMGVGTDKALVGTIRNVGPFDIKNISVFASVHDSNGTQIDTVRSNVIPVLHAGEIRQFIASPDPSIKEKVLYYSCAGLDEDAPISTVDVGNGKFVAFALQAGGEVADFRYNKTTDSINLVATPYGQNGAPFILKLPENSESQKVSVIVDGQVDNTANVKADGKMLTVTVNVPKGDHDLSIQGISTIPELPNASIPLVMALTLTALVVFTKKRRIL